MLSEDTLSEAELSSLVAELRAGAVVGCATETWFGLLANALDPAAVERVCSLKGRDPGSPVAVLLPDLQAISMVSDELDARVQRLGQRYWPGPLTLLVRAKKGLPPGLIKEHKIGVRVPGPSPALQLVRAFGAPLTATSANLSGQPAAGTAEEVRRTFPTGLAAVAGSSAPGGLASTILDTTTAQWVVVRKGPIEVDAAEPPER